MARTAIALQAVVRGTGAQLTEVAADAANGMMFPNDGDTELVVVTGGTGINVTIRSVPCSHGRSGDQVVAVAANKRAVFPKWDPALFNQSGTDQGNVYVDFSAGTSVTVAVVRRA